MTADDATSPLVAASPVPPVVPDSEALDWEQQPEFRAACDIEPLIFGEDHEASDDDWDLLRRIVREVRSSDASPGGSGVVPDKPALDPERHVCSDCGTAEGTTDLGEEGWLCDRCTAEHDEVSTAYRAYRDANASVPAVTDDEAAWGEAARVVREGLDAVAHHGLADVTYAATSVVAALRAKGFLLVRQEKP